MKLVAAGTKLPAQTYAHLKWLAYKRDTTTVSAIIASYVERGLAGEDLTGFVPSEREE